MSTKKTNTQETTNEILKGLELPPVEQKKVPQHLVVLELAKLGYRPKQIHEITNIKLTNVQWYYSKYKMSQYVQVESNVQVESKVEPKVEPKVDNKSTTKKTTTKK